MMTEKALKPDNYFRDKFFADRTERIVFWISVAALVFLLMLYLFRYLEKEKAITDPDAAAVVMKQKIQQLEQKYFDQSAELIRLQQYLEEVQARLQLLEKKLELLQISGSIKELPASNLNTDEEKIRINIQPQKTRKIKIE
jgi:hypothetical protein